MNGEVCKIEDCEKSVRSRGWCQNHYEKWRRTGHPLGTKVTGRKPKARAVHEKRCTICREVKTRENFYVSKKGHLSSYCKPCHNVRTAEDQRRAREKARDGRPKRQPVREQDCSFPGCVNEGRTYLNGQVICGSHYMQHHSGKELTPLRPLVTSYIDENVRRCTGCLEVKRHEAFHVRPNGKSQQRCKVCMGLGVRWATLMREGRLQEAVDVVERMPEPLREKYRGKTADRINSGEFERSNA